MLTRSQSGQTQFNKDSSSILSSRFHWHLSSRICGSWKQRAQNSSQLEQTTRPTVMQLPAHRAFEKAAHRPMSGYLTLGKGYFKDRSTRWTRCFGGCISIQALLKVKLAHHESPIRCVVQDSQKIPADFAHLQTRKLAKQVAKQHLCPLLEGLQPARCTNETKKQVCA